MSYRRSALQAVANQTHSRSGLFFTSPLLIAALLITASSALAEQSTQKQASPEWPAAAESSSGSSSTEAATAPDAPRQVLPYDPQQTGPRAPLAPCDVVAPDKADASVFTWPRYSKLRFNEDYSGLVGRKQIPYRDWLDRLKYLPLNDKGDVYATIGGQLRVRAEGYNNFNFGRPQDDDDGFYLLQRYFLNADIHVGPNLRFFVQTRTALANDRDLVGRRSATLHDDFDILNAFADVTVPINDDVDLMFRGGRFEQTYGQGRQLGCRDWSQLRRPKDGGLVRLRGPNWWVDGFYAMRTASEKYDWTDHDEDQRMFGFYAHLRKPASLPLTVEMFFFGDHRDTAPLDVNRNTVGGRLFGVVPNTALKWDIEGGYQFGDAEIEVDAFFIAIECRYDWKEVTAKPWVVAGFDYASGDDDLTDNVSKTFEPISPYGHYYFGFADMIGRQNIIHPWFQVGAQPIKPLAVALGTHFFFAAQPEDGIYNACSCGSRIRPGAADADRYMGAELDLSFKLKLDHHTVIHGGYAHFFHGPYISQTPGGSEDVGRWWMQFQYTF
jgi:hypothetical protein